MRTFDAEEVAALLSPEIAYEVMHSTLRQFGTAAIMQPLRTILRPDSSDSLMGVMPAHLAGDDTGFGVKIALLVPDSGSQGHARHVGMVMVFDPATGEPTAAVEAGAVTALRTAAVSAVATDCLARDDADTLAILGSGVQARSHLRALAGRRSYRRVVVWSPTESRARAMAAWGESLLGQPVLVAPTPGQAVAGAAVVVTATASKQPLLEHADIAPGTHINAVGASFRDYRELSSELVAAARFVVDSRVSALAESGDLLEPIREGLCTADDIRGELGEILRGEAVGRETPDDVTVFKSLGLAVEDVAAAFAVVRMSQADAAADLARA
ncbi:MAG: ornithine cyclodeaminase family protein [Propionibacteriaceae bacterium]|nr:ornithine cyclodeaminase family protein [Propionibacteriaceae bacterium]